jgi:hypothetical protein
VLGPGPDRYLAPELASAEELLRGEALIEAVMSTGAVIR